AGKACVSWGEPGCDARIDGDVNPFAGTVLDVVSDPARGQDGEPHAIVDRNGGGEISLPEPEHGRHLVSPCLRVVDGASALAVEAEFEDAVRQTVEEGSVPVPADEFGPPGNRGRATVEAKEFRRRGEGA